MNRQVLNSLEFFNVFSHDLDPLSRIYIREYPLNEKEYSLTRRGSSKRVNVESIVME
nr:MAG TPA: hypothetical protein [Caudoviricetes sp.]